MLIEVLDTAFDIGDVEPYTGTLAVFDVTANSKLTESYCFRSNSVRSVRGVCLGVCVCVCVCFVAFGFVPISITSVNLCLYRRPEHVAVASDYR